MKTFNLIVAWIVTILAVLGMLAVLVGLVGSWIVRNRVTDIGVEMLTVGETAVTTASDGLYYIDERLLESKAKVGELESSVIDTAGELQETSVLRRVISETIGSELALALNSAKETAVAVVELTFILNDAIDAVNDIPFVHFDGPAVTFIQRAADGIVSLYDSLTEMKSDLITRREDRIEGGKDRFTTRTANLMVGIGDVRGNLQAFNGELEIISSELAAFRESLPRTLTLITIGVNLVLLFIGIAFISLMFHCMSYIKNPDQTFKELTA